MNALTRPERCTELKIGRRTMAQVLADPCAHCLRRSVDWGEAHCSLGQRRYPMCMGDRKPSFDIDWSTITYPETA